MERRQKKRVLHQHKRLKEYAGRKENAEEGKMKKEEDMQVKKEDKGSMMTRRKGEQEKNKERVEEDLEVAMPRTQCIAVVK